MRTPNFWRTINVSSLLLAPLSGAYWAYIRILGILHNTAPHDFDIPIICVGNVVAGGAGKSPTAISLAKMLIDQGKNPIFVSKGYGGSFTHTMMVAPDTNTAHLVGDEPLMLSKTAPCVVCKTRVDGCRLAKESGADVIILDDGLHDQSIKKALTLLVIDGTFGLGNCLLLPAGPLRDTLKQGLNQSDAIVVVGEDTYGLTEKIKTTLPILYSTFVGSENPPPKDISYIAFSGIARPQKFFDGLNTEGYTVTNNFPFADHHPFSPAELKMLLSVAKENDSTLITTAKDMMRIPDEFSTTIAVFNIQVRWKDESAINKLLASIS
jgi:tetraacyldisaccharide 4'-kinase